MAIAALALLATGCTKAAAQPEPLIWVTVIHGDAVRAVRIDPGQTVGDALELAEAVPVDGQVVSALDQEPIKPNGDVAELVRDGEPIAADLILSRWSTIEVIDGTDTVEDTTTERRTLEPEGMPDALQHVHFGGKPGVEEVTTGVESGDVVSRDTITPSVPAHHATGPVLSLTFDDGPDPKYTPKILDVLADKGVTATFCQVGTEVEDHPELVERIVDEGHQLCNHTEHHVEGLEDKFRETVEDEISGGAAAIEEAAGVPAPYYRPPGGSLGDVIYEVAGEHNQEVLYWSIDPRDWKKPPPEEIVATVVNAFGPGGIILLHDGGGDRTATIKALPQIIDFARALGYTFTAPISNRPQVR